MSFQGYGGYANQLENRVIAQNWTSYWRRCGRMVFKRIYSLEDDRGIHNTIGFEMVINAASNRWQARQEPNNETWLFRCYHDGTGLYKQRHLEYVLNRYKTSQSITDVVFKHFYRDAVINCGSEYGYIDQVILLRRKPLSTYARLAAEEDNNFGDFLISKYNLGGELETVSD